MPADVARELLMLGILRRAPLSAYDVDRAVRGHAPLYRGLKRGNVYHALTRLAEARLLTQRTAKATRGPLATKTIYRLSAPGERHFHALLRTVLIIGGLSSSLVLTLFVVPLVYVSVRRARRDGGDEPLAEHPSIRHAYEVLTPPQGGSMRGSL
jgi:DNA-binding PadR family transcriptional regulator